MKKVTVDENHICEYGCEQKAKHQFENGKWCCSEFFTQCPAMKTTGIVPSEETQKKISESRKGEKNHFYGKTHSEKSKKKMSEAKSGKNNPRYGCHLTKEEKVKISKIHKGKTVSEKTKKKLRGKNNPMFGKVPHNKFTIKKLKSMYPLFSKIEEMRYNPDKLGEKEIQVHCKNHNCPNSKEKGGWFTPTIQSISDRIRSINHNDGGYLYCSNNCKQDCPMYGKRASQLIKRDQIKAGIIKEELYTAGEISIWSQKVKELANNKCEYCGAKAEHAHHIEPKKLQPNFALDPINGLACCSSCHYKYGHPTGTPCSTGQLSQIICS